MKETSVPLALARRIALNAQLLDGKTTLPAGKDGAEQTIQKLGYVQIDTIAVVERAHHHTLWARQPDYAPAMLNELLKERRVFEYWGHAASYLPMSDYRYYLPLKRSFQSPSHPWFQRRMEQCGHLMAPVLERIRQEGPLGSKDFTPPPGTPRGTWWNWKPAKIALELLFWRGDLMVAERRNFQRVYDLTERVLPEGVDTRVPDQAELGRFLVRRALAAHGLAREKEICSHIPAAGKDIITHALRELVDAGQVACLKIDGQPGTDYALACSLESATSLEARPPSLVLLSPFDNLVIQRERTKRLFGFDYTIECYLPAAKRKYGYFSLPLLWGEELIGRLDAKATRKSKAPLGNGAPFPEGVLIVRSLVLEPGFDAFEAFRPALGQGLQAFAGFNRCDTFDLERVWPAEGKVDLLRK
ncbi:MAG: YcaQ family DNA glycosylase [Thermoflexales bacterium]|nr:YcaQ family DNA glycosylase [Thermoflexales bacterium]